MKRLILMAASALLLMTQCRKGEVSPVTPGTMKLTVTAGPGRVTVDGNGAIKWTTDDRLWVSDGNEWLGHLDLKTGENSPTGTFSGNILASGSDNLHFFYLGSGLVAAGTDGNPKTDGGQATGGVTVSFMYQDGTGAGAFKYQLGHGIGSVTDGEGHVTMESKTALARISFTKASTNDAYGKAVIMDGEHIYNKVTVSPNGEFKGVKDKSEGVIIGCENGGSARYVMLLPSGEGEVAERVEFKGFATGGLVFADGIEAGKYYGRSEAAVVELTANVSADCSYVDFAIKDAPMFADRNVGATNGNTKESWYGYYFQWGSVTEGGDSDCSWDNCPGNGGNSSTNLDALAEWDKIHLENNVLKLEVDAANASWGSGWRMCTSGEWAALRASVYREWVTDYNNVTGLNGYVVYKAKGVEDEDKSGTTTTRPTVKYDVKQDIFVFLPAAGNIYKKDFMNAEYGFYWSSSKDEKANSLINHFRSDRFEEGTYGRNRGMSVRPVRVAR